MNITVRPDHRDKTLSFIIPAMNEEFTVKTLYTSIREAVDGKCKAWEVIFIDDGSTDGTWSKIVELAMSSTMHVRAFRFARNRGKADALALGYSKANADVVFSMDADLQDDPKEIHRFLDKLDEGYDIVSGWKKTRHDPWHKVLPSRVFNGVLSWVSGVKLHDHNCGFKAYRSGVVKNLPMYGDMHRMVPTLASFKGYQTAEIEVEHHARKHGVSKYGWSRIISGLLDMATVGFLKKFRHCPMHFTGKLASLLVAVAIIFIGGAVWLELIGTQANPCYVIASIAIFSAVLVFTQGLLFEQLTYSKMKEGRDLTVSSSINSDEEFRSYHLPTSGRSTREEAA